MPAAPERPGHFMNAALLLAAGTLSFEQPGAMLAPALAFVLIGIRSLCWPRA